MNFAVNKSRCNIKQNKKTKASDSIVLNDLLSEQHNYEKNKETTLTLVVVKLKYLS